jgi:hypothetical protein
MVGASWAKVRKKEKARCDEERAVNPRWAIVCLLQVPLSAPGEMDEPRVSPSEGNAECGSQVGALGYSRAFEQGRFLWWLPVTVRYQLKVYLIPSPVKQILHIMQISLDKYAGNGYELAK